MARDGDQGEWARAGTGRGIVVLAAAALLAAALSAAAALGATGDLTFSQCFDDEDTNLEGAKCANAPGLDFAASVAVSADGRSLYAASADDDAIVRFNRNTTTGALTFAQCFDDEDTNLEGARCTNAPGLERSAGVDFAASLAVSADGRSLYAASADDDAIVRFNRNTATGALTFAQCFDDEDTNPEGATCTNAPGLAGASSVAVSADGRSLYSASFTDNAIVPFDRTTTGALAETDECFEDEDGGGSDCTDVPGLAGASSVAVSADGRSLYATSAADGAIVRFNRNTATLALTFAECFDDEDTDLEGATCTNAPGLQGARSAAVSGDGRSLYAASTNDDAIASFNRTTSGDISFSECFDDEDTNPEAAKCTNAPGLDNAASVAVSGDGRSLYSASRFDDAIAGFNRTATTGALIFARCFDDEDTNLEGARCTNAPGLRLASSTAVSADGRSLYAGSGFDDAVVRFNRELPAGVNVPPSNEFEIGKLKGKKLTLIVPGPGTVDVTDAADQGPKRAVAAAKKKRLKPSTATAAAAGEVTVKLKLTRKAKKKLKDKGKVKVNAKVTFTPDGGEPNTETEKLKVKQ